MFSIRKVQSALLLTIVLGLLLAACGANPATGTPEADIPIVVDSGDIITEGRLEPQAYAQLSFLAGGQVAEVLVAEGASVAAGDVIARLQNRESLEAQVAQAEQEVLNATQAIQVLNDNAALAAARAEQEAAQLQEALEKAERRLRNLQSPDIAFYQEQVKKAQDALTTAQENAEITSIGDLEKSLQAARDNLDFWTAVYNDAQAKHDECPSCEIVFAASKGIFVKPDDAEKEFKDAQDAVRVLELRLEQARRNDASTLDDLQENLDTAKANLAAAQKGDPVKLALAEAEVALTQAQLADAQKRAAELQSGPDRDQLAAAEARLATANASREAAKTALANIELRAPIAGVVADLKLKVGEQVSPGVPVVTLAEFATWVVKTSNLTEIEVVRVLEGQKAEVVLDALPEVTLTGEVASISTVYQESRGDIVYTVTIELQEGDPRMRWGMTAQVTITP
jgi:HlyD family secretion protein